MTEPEARANHETCRTADSKMAQEIRDQLDDSHGLAQGFNIALNNHEEAYLQLSNENQRLKEEMAQKDAIILDHEQRDALAVERAKERDEFHKQNMELIKKLHEQLKNNNDILAKKVANKKADKVGPKAADAPVAADTVAPTTVNPSTPTPAHSA